MTNINQENVNRLAQDHYHSQHAEVASSDEIKSAVAQIVSEEKAKGLDELQTSRGCRTRIHELLQSKLPICDPPVSPTTNMGEMMQQMQQHHDHQAAHHQALWQHTDALYAEASK